MKGMRSTLLSLTEYTCEQSFSTPNICLLFTVCSVFDRGVLQSFVTEEIKIISKGIFVVFEAES